MRTSDGENRRPWRSGVEWSRSWRIGAGAALVLALSALAGCASTPNYVTGPQRALQIAQTYNLNNAKANFTLNTALQNKNEEGVSAQLDDAYYQMLRDEGKTSEGNGKPAHWHFTVYVFNQAATPAYFVAETAATKTSKGYGDLFLFKKDSPKGPWRVLYEEAVLAKNMPTFVSAGNGYVASAPLPKILVASPGAAISDLANYWSNYANASAPLGLLQSGPDTSTLNAEMQSVASGTASQHGSVLASFSEANTPILAFPTTAGALVFGVIDWSFVNTPPSGSRITQPSSRSNADALLAPGNYTSITYNEVTAVALLVPKAGHIAVLGADQGVVSASGSDSSTPTVAPQPTPGPAATPTPDRAPAATTKPAPTPSCSSTVTSSGISVSCS